MFRRTAAEICATLIINRVSDARSSFRRRREGTHRDDITSLELNAI